MSTLDQQLTTVFSAFPEIRLAILFGSRATGNHRTDSDIDLGLLADAPLSADLKSRIIEAVAAEIGCPVDIVDLFHGPEPVLGAVLKGRRLFGDAATYARLLNMHVFNVADFLPIRQRVLAERRAEWTR